MNVFIDVNLGEGYNGPVVVNISQALNHIKEGQDHLNGYAATEADSVAIANSGLATFKPSYPTLTYNPADKRIYVVNTYYFPEPPAEEVLTQLGKDVCMKTWSSSIVKDDEGNEYSLESQEDIYITHQPIHLPEDYIWLGAVLRGEPLLHQVYSEFMTDSLVNYHLNRYLDARKIPVKEGVDRSDSTQLPLHTIEPRTGEILVHTEIFKLFNEYYTAIALISVEDEVNSVIGAYMLASRRFANYILDTQEALSQGKQLVGLEENLAKEMRKVEKMLDKNTEILDLINAAPTSNTTSTSDEEE